MNILEVANGLKQGKKYQLPEWGRFYIYNEEDVIYLKSKNTEKIIYNLHITELESNKWCEYTEIIK